MEEKKLDLNSIIGFILIFGILIWIMYQQQPTEEELAAQKKAEAEKVEAEKKAKEAESQTKVTTAEDYSNPGELDSLQRVALQNKLGSFAYASTLSSAKDEETTVETDVFELKFNNKGGHLSQVKLKQFVDYDSVPIYLVQDGNSDFNINFATTDNRILNTRDLYFQPNVSQQGENTVVSMLSLIHI